MGIPLSAKLLVKIVPPSGHNLVKNGQIAFNRIQQAQEDFGILAFFAFVGVFVVVDHFVVAVIKMK